MKKRNLEIHRLTSEEIRIGADKIHEALDGKLFIPDWLGLLLVGVIGGVLPFVIGWIYKGSIL